MNNEEKLMLLIVDTISLWSTKKLTNLLYFFRFEKLDITPKSAQKIKPVLERWMKEAEERWVNDDHTLHDDGLLDIFRDTRTYEIKIKKNWQSQAQDR